ncbi:xylulokinase [Nakamurella sp. UYEF19]|uniref:xylulokinase n=1 Tax=Nakamurella sp. UYEF19 TaxID=1756392 RepID=UPI0033978B94
MAVPVWVGIDVGTTGAKVVVTGLDGQALWSGSDRYPRIVAPQGDVAGMEQDASLWWSAVAGLLRSMPPDLAVRAVAATSQAPSLVLVDAAGRAIGPALLWADRRAQAEAIEIDALLTAVHPDDPLATPADSYFGTAKLLWWARYRPALLEAATGVLATNGYVVRQLTGVGSLDLSTATMLQGHGSQGFSPVLSAAGVPTGLLPPVSPCTTLVGEVTAQAAALTGLPVGTPVAAGAIDAVGTALEAGVLEPGDPFAEMTGFSTVGMVAVPAGTPAQGFIRCRHCFVDTDLVISAQVTSGAVLDWIVALTGGDRTVLDPPALLARQRPAGVRMVPSLAGERTPTWNASARGEFSGLALDTDAVDLVLAAMEGTAMALAVDLDGLAANGLDIPLIRSTGGGSVNGAWLQIKADTTGRPVERPVSGSGAAQGAAYLAGLAVGDLEGADQVREFSAAVSGRYLPDPVRAAAYRERRAAGAQMPAPAPPSDTSIREVAR